MLFKQKTTSTSAIMAAVLALALSGTSYAAGNDVLKSNIPQIYGKSKDTFQGNDQKTIIHIQDAHGNVESQENIQAIIKTLAEQGKVDAIMDEGGWNEYDSSSFQSLSQDDKTLTADWLTKYGLIHGADRYTILDNPKMPVIGSEDKAAYMDGLKAFRDAGQARKESLAATEKIKGAMEAIKLKLFDEETRGFLQTSEDFKKDQITLTSYASALKTQAEKVGVNVASFNNFSKVIESITLEEKIDFAKIDRERLDMVDELETKVDKKVADEIVTQSLNYRLGKLAASEYYNFLLEKANSAKLDMSKYGNVTQYSSLVNLYASINDDALFAETDRLEGEIKSKLFKDQKQVEFDVHLKNLDVLNKLISLQMTRTDLAFWKENKDKISAAKTVAFLKDQAKTLGLAVELQDSLGQIDQKLASNEKFYEIALKRDDVMIEKTLAMMDEKGFKTVVLVAGGFHSEGIAKALKAKAISHMIVTPRITNPDAENFWMQNMMAEGTEASQLLKGFGVNAFTQATPPVTNTDEKGKPTLVMNSEVLNAIKAQADAGQSDATAQLPVQYGDKTISIEGKSYEVSDLSSADVSPAYPHAMAALQSSGLPANARIKVVQTDDLLFNFGARTVAAIRHTAADGVTEIYVTAGVLENSKAYPALLTSIGANEASEIANVASKGASLTAEAESAAILEAIVQQPVLHHLQMAALDALNKLKSELGKGVITPALVASVMQNLKDKAALLSDAGFLSDIGEAQDVVDAATGTFKIGYLDQLLGKVQHLEAIAVEAVNSARAHILTNLTQAAADSVKADSALAQTVALHVIDFKDAKIIGDGSAQQFKSLLNIDHALAANQGQTRAAIVLANADDEGMASIQKLAQARGIPQNKIKIVTADDYVPNFSDDSLVIIVGVKNDGLKKLATDVVSKSGLNPTAVLLSTSEIFAGSVSAIKKLSGEKFGTAILDGISGLEVAARLAQLRALKNVAKVGELVSQLKAYGKIENEAGLTQALNAFVNQEVGQVNLPEYISVVAALNMLGKVDPYVGQYA